MNKAIVMVAIAVVAAVGISSFALMSSESGPLPAPVVQEPAVLELLEQVMNRILMTLKQKMRSLLQQQLL